MNLREPAFDLTTAVRCPPTGKLSFQAFHDWLDEDTWAEWVDGQVHILLPSSYRHADLLAFLLLILRAWVEAHDLGTVLAAPFLMRLPAPVTNGREPDLLFLAHAHRARLRTTYVDGPVDLAVEIISPESITRDRVEKFGEYERAGIPEYWLLDPEAIRAEFYQLGPDGRYHLALAGADGVYVSPVLGGLRLPLSWLWREPLPKLREALQEIGLLG